MYLELKMSIRLDSDDSIFMNVRPEDSKRAQSIVWGALGYGPVRRAVMRRKSPNSPVLQLCIALDSDAEDKIEWVKDTFGEMAADTWMEGDISMPTSKGKGELYLDMMNYKVESDLCKGSSLWSFTQRSNTTPVYGYAFDPRASAFLLTPSSSNKTRVQVGSKRKRQSSATSTKAKRATKSTRSTKSTTSKRKKPLTFSEMDTRDLMRMGSR
jgi:hypothetical protein